MADKTIVRVIKDKNNPYVMLNKYFLDYEPEMSWKAKGMLTYLLSKPDDWTIMICDLIKKAGDGKDAVYSGFKELKKYRYMHYQKVRNERGRIVKHEYLIYETPYTDYPEMEKPDTVNPPLIINDNTNNDITDKSDLIEFDSIDSLQSYYSTKYGLPNDRVMSVYDRVKDQYKAGNIKSFKNYFEKALEQEKKDYEVNKFIL